MKLAFTLSMPGNNSWNGRWSGEDRCYVKIVDFGASKKATEKAEAILREGYYSYSFGDGWVAGISVKAVEGDEARKLKRKSAGFCGYHWMVDSIRFDGDIYGPAHPLPAVPVQGLEK